MSQGSFVLVPTDFFAQKLLFPFFPPFFVNGSSSRFFRQEQCGCGAACCAVFAFAVGLFFSALVFFFFAGVLLLLPLLFSSSSSSSLPSCSLLVTRRSAAAALARSSACRTCDRRRLPKCTNAFGRAMSCAPRYSVWATSAISISPPRRTIWVWWEPSAPSAANPWWQLHGKQCAVRSRERLSTAKLHQSSDQSRE